MKNTLTMNISPETHDIPAEYKINPDAIGTKFLVNGEVLTCPKCFSEVYSPIIVKGREGENPYYLGRTCALGWEEARPALLAAEKAFNKGIGSWPLMASLERVECMQAFVKEMRTMAHEVALMEMWEICKPYPACRDEFHRTLDYIENTMKALEDMERKSNHFHRIENYLAQVRRTPAGVMLCMGPFNYPLNETFAMAIPALLMGNTMVLKLPRYGCLCTVPLLQAFADCFPPGVINIINGDGETIIQPMIKSSTISLLAFIGSNEVAKLLISQHPHSQALTTVLGLEAKNPAFIFPDADLELAVRECINGAFEFNGQRCTALKHLWVHEDIEDAFVSLFISKIEELKCGLPWEEGVIITPLPEKNKITWLSHLIEDAIEKGARVVNKNGGETIDNMMLPTALFPVDMDMQISKVEQFGPVIPISRFTNHADLVEYLLSTSYGQQASIFTQSPENAAPLIDILVNQVSRINLNAQCRRSPDELPFSGRKNSAEGTLSVQEALHTFSLPSLVTANEQGRDLFIDVLKSNKSKFLRI